MERGIFATVEHRKLMELKNSGAVDADTLEMLANEVFKETKAAIVAARKVAEKNKSLLVRILNFSLPVEKEVELMFTTRCELVDHLDAVEVPTQLCPINQEMKDRLIFVDRAALFAQEGREVLDMFKRHDEVIVDPELSVVIDWILQNAWKIRSELNKGMDNE